MMSYIKAPKKSAQKYYDYLEELRQSGITNMWGATPYLQVAFPSLGDKRAREIHLDWIEAHSDPERVIKQVGP